MELLVRMPEDSISLPSLRSWLVRDPEFRGRVTLVPAPAEGQLSGAWDAVVIAVGSGGVGAVFLQTLSEWLKHRRPEQSFELTIKDGEREVTGTFKNIAPEEARELLRRLDTPSLPSSGDDDTP
ncbi:hypothetical protein SK854_45915 [Lentzea sp. BCCO 10_0061]|uniref:Uncharacterized protein n=1 Tax=Lentzea sokolovensis TaxID=3095429 RepID=A0ABU4VCJ2_9PSEU|nr:hypothetical protein [Lentzea sp. BCCO 10_0061]MDX8149528.1 hypothetical protein [Lentzea sp. BCCO 10_0061]